MSLSFLRPFVSLRSSACVYRGLVPALHSANVFNQKRTKATVTLMPGDGIGPEIADSVIQIFEKAGAPIKWEKFNVGTEAAEKTGILISDEVLDSVRQNKVALKGPMATPIGKGHRSLNLTLRRALELYANVRPALSIPGIKTRYDDVDLVVVRENTEDLYSGLEHEVAPGVCESIKLITRPSSMRIATAAFEYARDHSRKKVTAVHKANIMKLTDGLFLQCCREVSEKYPDIQFSDIIIDNCCMQLVKDPAQFDVLVLPNLYGDIVSDLCAGLIGGLGLTPSGNYGEKASMFEAVHGTAPDIAGQDLANPTALLLSGVMMLHHMKFSEVADKIREAVLGVFAEGKTLTKDLGGNATRTQFTNAVLERL